MKTQTIETIQAAEEIGRLIREAGKVLIISHIAPDGDTVGSALALAWALRGWGLDVRLSCADPVPRELRFLPGSEEYAARSRTDEDIILAIDAGDVERIGRVYDADAFSRVPVINIDHHTTNTRYGDVNLVVDKAATAEVIYDLLMAWDIEVDERIATCLLTGMITDTQGFRTSNTTPDLMRTSVQLMEAGAPLPQIMDVAFNRRSTSVLRVWGPALTNAHIADGIVWAEITRELLREAGVTGAAVKGLVNFFSSLDGPLVALVFRETEDQRIEVGFRSVPGIDISGVALAFGGGGHPQAAGCMVSGELADVRERVLAAVRQAISDQSEDDGVGPEPADVGPEPADVDRDSVGDPAEGAPHL
jgi:phosphoesterase RecJ-like protein